MIRPMETIRDIADFAAKARKFAAGYENAVAQRDAAIARAWADGIRRQDIADAAGLSVQRISQMAAGSPRKPGRRPKEGP